MDGNPSSMWHYRQGSVLGPTDSFTVEDRFFFFFFYLLFKIGFVCSCEFKKRKANLQHTNESNPHSLVCCCRFSLRFSITFS